MPLSANVVRSFYIGETITSLSTRSSDHLRSDKSYLIGRPVAAHFNSIGQTIENAKRTGILSTSGNLDKYRHSAEQRIISKLQTLHLHGITLVLTCYERFESTTLV